MHKFLSISLTSLLAVAASAQAGEVTGVNCPSGYDVTISNSDKKLLCQKRETITLASGCLGVMNPTGADTCLPVGTGSLTPSGPVGLLPGVHPALSKFRRVVNPSAADKFVANVVKHAFPEGAIYVGNASKAVSCPAGFDGDKSSSGRGIRCDKVVANNVAADCDFGWTLRVDDQGQNRDKCIGVNGVGNTKPRGITGVQFGIEDALPNVKWHLAVNNGGDKWKKKEYAYPKAN